MWSLLSLKYQTWIIVIFSWFSFETITTISKIISNKNISFFHYIPTIVTVITVIILPFANIIWLKLLSKYKITQKNTFPNINGIWYGTLKSNWIDPNTQKQIDPIQTELDIRQTLLKTHIFIKTNESRSYSTRVFLERFPENNHFRIWYSYTNDPKASVQHRSKIHEGVACLDMYFDESPNHLTGYYYTARFTMGELDFTRNTDIVINPIKTVKS